MFAIIPKTSWNNCNYTTSYLERKEARKMRIFKKMTTSVLGGLLAAIVVSAAPAYADTQTKSGSFYEIKIATSVKEGKLVATITITGKDGYHPNKDYPWKLTVNFGPGINEKKIMKKKDAKQFDIKAVIFEVTTEQSNSQKISAELKLGMCDPKQCKMERVPLTWTE
jgi:hypothetical protein